MELTEQGFYELRARDKDVVVVAANVDPAEADLTPDGSQGNRGRRGRRPAKRPAGRRPGHH